MSTIVIDSVVDSVTGPATGAPRGDQLGEINRKLDLLAQNMLVMGQQVNFLMEQADNNRRRLQSVDDLLADLTPVVKDVYAAAEEQLEEMQQFVTLEDVTALAKRLARNTRNFNELLDTLESAQDFVRDAAPLTKEMMTEATDDDTPFR
jgi:chromosomal replication initiation ATPase DnaA